MTLKLIDLLEIKLKILATSKFNQVGKQFFPLIFSQKIVNKITPPAPPPLFLLQVQ
jgi:hypothetical protein